LGCRFVVRCEERQQRPPIPPRALLFECAVVTVVAVTARPFPWSGTALAPYNGDAVTDVGAARVEHAIGT
jgi:hypothetical protein